MRLTLRTLLAYLDDTLEPAQAKLIGQKVAESPAAQELIARIKEVVRRRRLTTPPPGGISDPNTIAEYIDSELPGERLAEVEEACLSSDVHLAEIAASHQILTVVLSEPILVPPTAKRRMYGLRRGREASARRRPVTDAATPEQDGPAVPPDATDDTLLLGLPLYPRHGSWFRRLAPILGVVVLAGALVAVIAISLANIAPKHDSSEQPSGSDNRLATVPNTGADQNTAGKNDQTSGKPDQNGTTQILPDKTTAVQKNQHTSSGAGKTGATDHQEANPDKNSKSNHGATVKQPPVKTPPVKPVNNQTVGQYVSDSGPRSILYQRPTDKDVWQRVSGPRSPIASGSRLLSLPGYRSVIGLPSGVQLTLWGTVPDPNRLVPVAESAVVLSRDPAFDADLTLQRGRLAITNHKTNPARVRLRFERETWEITLNDPGSEIIVERWGIFPPGVSYSTGAVDDGPAIGTALVASHGTAELKTGYFTHQLHEPPGPALYLWDNTGGDQTTPRRLEKLQSWFTKTSYPASEAEVLDNLSTRLEKDSPETVLPQIIKDDKQFARQVAVHSLAALDDLGGVITALQDDNHRDVRLEAINALRRWMALEKGNAEKLHAALHEKLQSTGEIVNALLYTYSIEQLNDPSTWELLITYLKHPSLAVRELADSQLTLLLPELHAQVPYDPAASADQRNVAVAMWKRLIPPGKLPPRPDQPGATDTPGKQKSPRRRP